MFEGVLERLLLKLFGEYVQEFNRDQLHVSMYDAARTLDCSAAAAVAAAIRLNHVSSAHSCTLLSLFSLAAAGPATWC